MEIRNSFDVPLPPPDAWRILMDVPRIAPCMPGAELLETVDERTYKGKVAVKLGPIALTFTGTASFQDIDDAAHSAKLKAQGSDTKGRGRADATVTFSLTPIPEGSRVDVVTDMTLVGAVAQYGRGAGLIQNVASVLVSQFADCLKGMLEQERAAAAPAAQAGYAAAPAETAAGTPAPPRTPSAPTPPPVAAKPVSGLSLLAQALWASFLGLFRRKN
jgi:uncharacterized protein